MVSAICPVRLIEASGSGGAEGAPAAPGADGAPAPWAAPGVGAPAAEGALCCALVESGTGLVRSHPGAAASNNTETPAKAKLRRPDTRYSPFALTGPADRGAS